MFDDDNFELSDEDLEEEARVGVGFEEVLAVLESISNRITSTIKSIKLGMNVTEEAKLISRDCSALETIIDIATSEIDEEEAVIAIRAELARVKEVGYSDPRALKPILSDEEVTDNIMNAFKKDSKDSDDDGTDFDF